MSNSFSTCIYCVAVVQIHFQTNFQNIQLPSHLSGAHDDHSVHWVNVQVDGHFI